MQCTCVQGLKRETGGLSQLYTVKGQGKKTERGVVWTATHTEWIMEFVLLLFYFVSFQILFFSNNIKNENMKNTKYLKIQSFFCGTKCSTKYNTNDYSFLYFIFLIKMTNLKHIDFNTDLFLKHLWKSV